MSHADYLRARALHMRVRAAILQHGDASARTENAADDEMSYWEDDGE